MSLVRSARPIMMAIGAAAAAAAGFGDRPTSFQLWMLAIAALITGATVLFPSETLSKKTSRIPPAERRAVGTC
ncbi:hypothetical protein [Dactylosporangium salmoneum]|uniref:hypothetical protein n=1 Tax=Dactylosporangium salmoneum TaxID=53361 RepID=UPI0031D02E7C